MKMEYNRINRRSVSRVEDVNMEVLKWFVCEPVSTRREPKGKHTSIYMLKTIS